MTKDELMKLVGAGFSKNEIMALNEKLVDKEPPKVKEEPKEDFKTILEQQTKIIEMLMSGKQKEPEPVVTEDNDILKLLKDIDKKVVAGNLVGVNQPENDVLSIEQITANILNPYEKEGVK